MSGLIPTQTDTQKAKSERTTGGVGGFMSTYAYITCIPMCVGVCMWVCVCVRKRAKERKRTGNKKSTLPLKNGVLWTCGVNVKFIVKNLGFLK